MKLLEIIKYNGALFLLGIFFVLISSVSSGNLLLNYESGTELFVLAICAGMFGAALGQHATRGYDGKAEFVPDYFIVILPLTAFPVVFSTLFDQMAMFSFYYFIWGFSLGVCFGLLIRSNPNPKFTGYPVFALGAFAGGILAIPVLSGDWHLCETYAVSGVLIALVPSVLFSDKLKSRKSKAIVALIGLLICAISVLSSRQMKVLDNADTHEAKLIRQPVFHGEKTDLVGVTPFVPALLQPNYAFLRILLAEPKRSSLSQKLLRLPFVNKVINIQSYRQHRYCKPFCLHNGIRKSMTGAVASYEQNTKHRSPFNVIILLSDNPLSSRDNRLFTKEFYVIASHFLMPGGIIITNANDYKEASVIRKTMEKVFKNAEVFPGRSEKEVLVVGSNQPLTIDYNELDRRAAERLNHVGFCRGMLLALLPPRDYFDTMTRVGETTRKYDINTDLNPYYINRNVAGLFSAAGRYVAIGALLVYLILRFLFSRKIERRIAFSSFENGIYCGGFALISMFIMQAIEGRLYLYLGWMISIFIIGSACGLGMKGEKSPIRFIVMLFSLLLPGTFLLYSTMWYQEFYLVIICIYMLFAGFFGGAAAGMFSLQLKQDNYRDYINWTLGGIAFGAGFCWLSLASPWLGINACIILLAASRLPLLFRPLK